MIIIVELLAFSVTYSSLLLRENAAAATAAAAAAAAASTTITKQPVVGILAQEISPEFKQYFPNYSFFFVCSYVQAVESSGAKVVPILPRRPAEYYKKMLNSVNAVVLPGGSSTNKVGYPYYDAIKIIYNIAREMNDNGTHYPILGVCLGYEFLITAANKDRNILKRCDIFHRNYPLDFTVPYDTSNLFQDLNSHQAAILENTPSTYNWHKWCAFEDDFKASPIFSEEWRITSTSVTKNGTKFIASVEHNKYPFFGIQFHPEKIPFEWHQTDNVPHDHDAIIANRYFYDRLVEMSKKNDKAFPTREDEIKALIYNYKYTYTLEFGDHFMCMYVFN